MVDTGEFHDCTLDISAITPNGLPNLQNIVNLNYQAPRRSVAQLKILIYDAEGPWDYAPHLISKTLKIVDRTRFEKSTLSFLIEDASRDRSNLPHTGGPRARMRIMVTNANETAVFFKGYLKPPKPMPLRQREDFTEYRYLQLSAEDETYLFRRVQIKEIITNTVEGAMFADLIGRYAPELDISGIDLTLGIEIEIKAINRKYLFEVIQDYLDSDPEATFFLERRPWPQKTIVHLKKKSDVESLLSIEVTDQNVNRIFDPNSFWAAPSLKAYKNQVTVQYYELYNQGSVNVSEGDFIVYGFGTSWYGKLFPGDKFRIPGRDGEYTIRKNNSSSDNVVQELYLQGNYEQTTATGIAYEAIKSKVSEYTAQDPVQIEELKDLNQEIGEFGGIQEITIPPGPEALLPQEAQRIANQYLRFDFYEGGASGNNKVLAEPNIGAGRTIRVSRPLYGVDTELVLHEVTISETGIRLPIRGDGRDDPYLKYGFKFTDKLFSEEGQFRTILLNLRRPKVRDTETIEVTKHLPEKCYFTDCVQITEGKPLNNEYSLNASVDIVVPDTAGPWYAGPIEPGQKEIYAIGFNGEYFEAS